MKASLVVLLLLPVYVIAQVPGAFTATGNMIVPRTLHSATLLVDGRVLIAGGVTGSYRTVISTEASAEVYDPVTQAFTPTGTMTTPREEHTATLLPNRKVLIAGGRFRKASILSALSSAEIYDPATGTFSPAGNMTTARAFHTATLLSDGRVLIVGGIGDGFRSLKSAEVYDPTTGTFTAVSEMRFLSTSFSAFADAATLLPNAKVLIINGNVSGDLGSAELYDPSAAVFSPTGDAIPGYSFDTATLLPNGKVLVAGGSSGYKATDRAELYDPATGVFAAAGNLAFAQFDSATVLLPDGTVLLTGGYDGDLDQDNGPNNTGGAEIYSPATSAFSATSPMLIGRGNHRATLLNSGRVLITGGNTGLWSQDIVATAELYTPAVLVPPPALLSLSGDGNGPGAIQHAGTYQIVSPENPAVPGETLIIYCIGLAGGSVIPPRIAIDGRMAEVLWFGNTPGYVGLNQINVRVPNGGAPGPAVPVRINYIGRSSNEVTIAVQ